MSLNYKQPRFEVRIDRWRFRVLEDEDGASFIAIYVFDRADDLAAMHKYSFFVPSDWANTRTFQFIDAVRHFL